MERNQVEFKSCQSELKDMSIHLSKLEKQNLELRDTISSKESIVMNLEHNNSEIQQKVIKVEKLLKDMEK